jgi:hypothetical protein
MRYPKFEKAIREKVVDTAADQSYTAGYGIILDYDTTYNTATIMMSDKGSDGVGEMLTDVPCPTFIGLQLAAPEPGRPCWVNFKDNNQQFPVVTHYFNPAYNKIDYAKQTTASNTMPRFILGM